MGKCTECNQSVGETPYNPMPEWKLEAPLCGKCYSKNISKHYPGEHVRLNRMDEDQKKKNLR
jgi:hypothetical protein